MPNDVAGMSREFVAIAVHGASSALRADGVVPVLMADLNACEGSALHLMELQDDFEIAHAALVLAALAAVDSQVRRLSLEGLVYSMHSSVDDILLSAAFDLDERVRRLALEGSSERKSTRLMAVCDLLAMDNDPELAGAAASARTGKVIPFFELESAETLGIRRKQRSP